MRINEVTSHIQHLPTPTDKHVYIVPVRCLGTCTIKSSTAPKKAHVVVDNQVIGNETSDITFEDAGGGEIIAMAECFGNIIVNAENHEELENLVKDFTPNLHTPIGDFTLKKGRVKIVGNVVRVDFQQQSIMVKVDRTGEIHAH
ncbi:hypothetical protein [Terasakiella sp. SH-1]|uniref:hypothetical protein n=1 Tax=Terasakiella sp. SH-1 TaxID=2560057 RepID=UPI0010733D43|nr:hypothetical protein [Terasakiella sp. SH-1]